MAIKLYGSDQSTCTKRVAVVLHEKNVPFEFHPIDFATGEHKSPAYMEHQPFGQVPYIVTDDGFELYESRAIARFIEESYPNQGTSLIPKDPKARAKFDQAASVEVSNFDVYASGITYEVIFKQFFKQETDAARVEALKQQWQPKLDAYEKILSTQKYLAGNEITLADLSHLSYGTMIVDAVKLDVLTDTAKRPNVARWWADISGRESWAKVKGGVVGTA